VRIFITARIKALNFSFKFIQATGVDTFKDLFPLFFYVFQLSVYFEIKSLKMLLTLEKKSQDEKTDKIKLKVLKLDAFDNLFPYFGEDGG